MNDEEESLLGEDKDRVSFFLYLFFFELILLRTNIVIKLIYS